MLRRHRDAKPTAIELADKRRPKPEKAAEFRSLNFQPLKTRDPRVLVVANLLLNAPESENGTKLPDDLRKWASDILGVSDVR